MTEYHANEIGLLHAHQQRACRLLFGASDSLKESSELLPTWSDEQSVESLDCSGGEGVLVFSSGCR